MAQPGSQLRPWTQIADAMRKGGETSAFIAKARKLYGTMVPAGPYRHDYLSDLIRSPKGAPYEPQELLTNIRDMPPEDSAIIKQSYLKELSRMGETGEEIGRLSEAFFPRPAQPFLPQSWEELKNDWLLPELAAFQAGGLQGTALGLLSQLGRGAIKLGGRALATGLGKKALPSLASRLAEKEVGIRALRAMREKGELAAREAFEASKAEVGLSTEEGLKSMELFKTARASALGRSDLAAREALPGVGQKLLPPARELMPEVFPLRGRATLPPTGRVIEQGPRRVPPSIMPPRGEGYPARITERITRPIREELPPRDIGRQVVLQGKKVVPERPSSSPFLRLAEEERVAQALQQRQSALQAVYDRLPKAHGQVRRVAMDMIEGKPIAKADLKRAQAIELQVKEYLTPKARSSKLKAESSIKEAAKAATPQPKEFDPSVPGEMLPNTDFRKMVDETLPGGLF